MKKRFSKITCQPLSVYRTAGGEYYFHKKIEFFFSEYPKTTVQIPMYCVCNVSEDDDNVSTSLCHRYEYAHVHLQSKRFLGLETIIKKDLVRDITKYNYITLSDSLYLPCELTARSQKGSTTTKIAVQKSGKILSSLSSYRMENDHPTSLSKTIGYLTRVTDRAGRQIWQVLAGNARGQIEEEKKGNVTTSYDYDDRGWPIYAYAQGIVDLLNDFNAKGNLTYRDNYAVSGPPMEHIGYDNLNRLKSWRINSRIDSVTYNNVGNIQSKSDLGGYTMNYGENGKPHALTSVAGVPTGFPASDLSITYTDFKKIKTLSEGNKTYDVVYGIDEQRRKSLYKENNAIKETRYYFGDYEEKTDHTSGITEKIHYLGNAIYIEKSNGLNDFYYTYTDYQGSLAALVREDGSVAERYAFDPWGKRRNPSNWTQTDSRTGWLVNRGYTMHEHLDAFGLINMNGRVYDPLTAQFFSPDPYIQAPDNWLNYNRYSYCLNNPFKYTDPDGENPILIAAIIIGAAAGGYTGYRVANANGYNIGDWQTWGYMLGGAAIGGVSGYAGATIATGGGFMANTLGIMYSSHVSSVGMTILSEGEMTPSINFGPASYNFGTGEWGYLGKEDNKWYQDLGYGLGLAANLRDISNLSFFNQPGTEYTSKITEVNNAHSHSAWRGDDGSAISFGPEKLSNAVDRAKAATLTKSTTNYIFETKDALSQSVSLNKYAVTTVNGLGKILPYNAFSLNCVNMQSIAYWLSGIPNIGLHPYFLYATSYLYQNGFRPDLYSYWLTNNY